MSFIVDLIRGLFSAYWYVLLATAIIGFVPEMRETRVGQVLASVTDPYLYIFRRYIRPLPIGSISIDLSWIVGVAVFLVVEQAISTLLLRLLVSLP